MSRCQFVADHCERYGVQRLCTIVGLARSSYYYWKDTAGARAARAAADAELVQKIRGFHAASDGTYGVPRITADLHDAGQVVNHKRVARVMRTAGIQGLRLRRSPRTTIPDPTAAKAPDLIGRDFSAPAPNQRYVGDITYLPTGSGSFLYLATVIDLCSRRLVGYAIADHMRTELVIEALAMAQRVRGSLDGAIFHADHGAQYTSQAFADACKAMGVRQSMSAVGSSADNAAAESFNASLKRETLQGKRTYAGEHDARVRVFGWVHRYNTTRRHSRLGQRSPIAWEITRALSSTLCPSAAA